MCPRQHPADTVPQLYRDLTSLRRLLGSRTAVGVLAHISSSVELPDTALDLLPNLARSRRGPLRTHKPVDLVLEVVERVLDVRALREARAEEGGVDRDEDPGAALEEDGGEGDAEPEEDLERGDDGHGVVVVGADEDADLVGDGVRLRLSVRRGGGGRGLDGGNEVGARVGQGVEDGVDAVGEEGERVLRAQEPDDGQAWGC